MSVSQDIFLENLGQTSPFPFLIEIDKAEGIYIHDKSGKIFMDMISGVSVNNIGHRHPKVVDALHKQIDRHLHVMVYGEFIQDSVSLMAQRLVRLLPNSLDCVYPVNSGTEAIEASLKLVKRATYRTEIVAFTGSYHGSTMGSLSVSGNELKKMAFRPLMPDVRFIQFNNIEDLIHITKNTAGVIVETIQGDAGVRIPDVSFMKALRKRCDEVGAMLIFDEIQAGLGRTGKMFAFEHFGVVPDVLTLGKALGGGMNIGALISSKTNLALFTHNPMLGHITTFGGHPVPCAAAAAALDVLSSLDFDEVERLGKRLEDILHQSEEVIEIRRIGMFFAIDMKSADRVSEVVARCLELGVLTFWFLSHPYSFRLSPPLTISEEEIDKAGLLILNAIVETKS
jgi:acetylornithine/succinyldiaminopimelate/putrescine aminotransferase